ETTARRRAPSIRRQRRRSARNERRIRGLLATRAARVPQRKARRSRSGTPAISDRRPSGSCQSQGRWIAAAIINERMETAQIAASITLPIAKKRRYAGLPSANRFHFVQLVAPAAAVATRPDPMKRYSTHRFPVSQIERVARKLNP